MSPKTQTKDIPQNNHNLFMQNIKSLFFKQVVVRDRNNDTFEGELQGVNVVGSFQCSLKRENGKLIVVRDWVSMEEA